MSNEINVAKTAAKIVSDKANNQILSHCIMALRQNIEDRLNKNGDLNSTFEDKIKFLHDKDVLKAISPFYKAYVYLDDAIEQGEGDSANTFARIYSKIDKVLSVDGKSISYALHLRIISRGNGTTSYNEGFIAEDCGRFAIGHDIEHAVLNLDDLIKNATTDDSKSIVNATKQDEYEADFFSYILSDFRDFYRLKLDGKLDLDKTIKKYKDKIISKYLKFIIKEIMSNNGQTANKIDYIIENISNRIKKVSEKSKKLYDDSLRYTMSHPIIALSKIINSDIQSKISGELEKLRKEADKKSKEYESEKESIMLTEYISKNENEIKKRINNIVEIKRQMEKLDNEIVDLDNKKPRINIHLIVKKDHKELTIDCYNRRDDNSKKDSYCFEIVINKFSNKEKNKRCEEICKAIGLIYFNYQLIIDRFKKNNEEGHFMIPDMSKFINELNLNNEEINDFANELCTLRNHDFENKSDDVKQNTKLRDRLINCAVSQNIHPTPTPPLPQTQP